MKRFTILLVFLAFFSTMASASVYIRYYNKDAKDYKFSVNIGGQMKTVDFGSSRSASVVIAGSGDTCIINSLCGAITIKNNTKIVIENGCIKIQYSTEERDQ